MRSGPGVSPCTRNAPSRTAVTASPGMPRVSSGTRVAPEVPLFADSAATTPSSDPLPNCSGRFDTDFAREYARYADTVGPNPGITPTRYPIRPDRPAVRAYMPLL